VTTLAGKLDILKRLQVKKIAGCLTGGGRGTQCAKTGNQKERGQKDKREILPEWHVGLPDRENLRQKILVLLNKGKRIGQKLKMKCGCSQRFLHRRHFEEIHT
jgi:hypothetical protein